AEPLRPADARPPRRAKPLREPRPQPRPPALLAPAASVAIPWHPHPPAGPATQPRRRPGGDAVVGGDALPVPRRGRRRLPGPPAPALEVAGLHGQVSAPAAGGAVAPARDRLAPQGDVPGAFRHPLRRAGASFRGPAPQPGVAAQVGLLRRAGGLALAAGVRGVATAVGPPGRRGAGPGRRGRDPAVAPPIPGRQPARPPPP